MTPASIRPSSPAFSRWRRRWLIGIDPLYKEKDALIDDHSQLRFDERATIIDIEIPNPDIPLGTNHVERELRPQTVGRKNGMFHVTEVGARYAGIFYSLIRSCIVAGIDPTVYLTHVLQRIAILPLAKKNLLIPRLWKEHFSGELTLSLCRLREYRRAVIPGSVVLSPTCRPCTSAETVLAQGAWRR